MQTMFGGANEDDDDDDDDEEEEDGVVEVELDHEESQPRVAQQTEESCENQRRAVKHVSPGRSHEGKGTRGNVTSPAVQRRRLRDQDRARRESRSLSLSPSPVRRRRPSPRRTTDEETSVEQHRPQAWSDSPGRSPWRGRSHETVPHRRRGREGTHRPPRSLSSSPGRSSRRTTPNPREHRWTEGSAPSPNAHQGLFKRSEEAQPWPGTRGQTSAAAEVHGVRRHTRRSKSPRRVRSPRGSDEEFQSRRFDRSHTKSSASKAREGSASPERQSRFLRELHKSKVGWIQRNPEEVLADGVTSVVGLRTFESNSRSFGVHPLNLLHLVLKRTTDRLFKDYILAFMRENASFVNVPCTSDSTSDPIWEEFVRGAREFVDLNDWNHAMDLFSSTTDEGSRKITFWENMRSAWEPLANDPNVVIAFMLLQISDPLHLREVMKSELETPKDVIKNILAVLYAERRTTPHRTYRGVTSRRLPERFVGTRRGGRRNEQSTRPQKELVSEDRRPGNFNTGMGKRRYPRPPRTEGAGKHTSNREGACFKCGLMGHIRRDCPQFKKSKLSTLCVGKAKVASPSQERTVSPPMMTDLMDDDDAEMDTYEVGHLFMMKSLDASLVSVRLNVHPSSPRYVTAMWDTGCSHTVVNEDDVDEFPHPVVQGSPHVIVLADGSSVTTRKSIRLTVCDDHGDCLWDKQVPVMKNVGERFQAIMGLDFIKSVHADIDWNTHTVLPLTARVRNSIAEKDPRITQLADDFVQTISQGRLKPVFAPMETLPPSRGRFDFSIQL
jgi:hypothetical protein